MSDENHAQAMHRIKELCDLTILAVDDDNPSMRIDAIFGSPTTESSFKSILGLGLLILARDKGLLKPRQTVIESTSGSLGVGIAAAGKLMNHPIVLVSDINMPPVTKRKIELLGADLVLVDTPDAVGGFQKAREDKLQELLKDNPDWYWSRQNDSDLNPLVYERFLVPKLADKITANNYNAAIFCVGSGGHFSAFSKFFNEHGIPTYVADREGSVTFGGEPKPSSIRGSGNQHGVPKVIKNAMKRVEGVYIIEEEAAYQGVHELARKGIYVGPSSGVCWQGAKMLAKDIKNGRILTFFPDRGEIYGADILAKNTIG